MKIGFIDLGIMGSRMAANLQKQGRALVVFNRTRAKAEPLLGPCGTFSDSPAKVADQVDILFTMLANPDAVEEVALRANGFLNIFGRMRFGSIAVRLTHRSRRRWPLQRPHGGCILSMHL
jgi:3-hydroxyisobutyrate dehydrogenase-like beta-hydroxyacid dehydrogenase